MESVKACTDIGETNVSRYNIRNLKSLCKNIIFQKDMYKKGKE